MNNPKKPVNLVKVEELIDFLGVDEDSKKIVENAYNGAIEEIERVTGVDWTVQANTETAKELVRIMVYLTYYGQRGGADNIDYLEKRRIQLTKMLQYSNEAMTSEENI